MRRSIATTIALAAAMLVVIAAGPVPAAETVESLIKKVDSKLYYPQGDGMRSLQADVESSWLQSMLENAPEAKNVKLTFYWAAPYKQRFVVSGAPATMAEQARQVERQLAMWGERLVPKPLAIGLKDYKTTLKEDEKTYVLDARTTQPTTPIWAMRYTIDKKTLLPIKWHLSTDNWDADVDIKLQKLESGKFLPVELKAKADSTEVTIRLACKKIGKLTVAETLTVTFIGDDGSQQSSTLKLSNHKINQPIPANLFPPEKR